MNEIQNANSGTSETVATLTPQKPNRFKLFIAMAAVVVVAAIGISIKMAFNNPKVAVEAAFAATAIEQKAMVESLYQNMPVTKILFGGRGGIAEASAFNLKIKSIENNPYSPLINIILKDAAISGRFCNDPEQKTTYITTSTHLHDELLLEANAFASPKLIAVGIPTFSKTAISINPSCFARDYESSALNTLYPIDAATLDMVQNMLLGQIEYYSTLSSVSFERMQKDISTILKRAIANATYTYDKRSQTYLVDIPNSDFKNGILDYYRYIYFESELSAAMKGMLEPTEGAAVTGQSYEDTINILISEIESSLPNADALLKLDIKKGLIKTAGLTCAASDDSNYALDSGAQNTILGLALECSFDGASNATKLNMTTSESTDITIEAAGSLSKEAYALDITMALNSEHSSLRMPVKMRIASDGAYECSADMEMHTDSKPIKAGFALNGTAELKNDVLTLNLPDSRIYSSASATAAGTLIFDLDYTNSPLTETLTPLESTALFELDAQQISRIGNEYSVGYESLIGRLFSLLMR